MCELQPLHVVPWAETSLPCTTCRWSFGILVYKVCSLGRWVASTRSQGHTSMPLCLSYTGAAPFAGVSPGDIYHEIGAGRRPNMLGCCSSDMYVLVWSLLWA